MTEIERKALALVAQLQEEDDGRKYSYAYHFEALCRAIEQHERFRQEVSEAVEAVIRADKGGMPYTASGLLSRFIIKPPVDPLLELIDECFGGRTQQAEVDNFRTALAARGGRIVFDGGE